VGVSRPLGRPETLTAQKNNMNQASTDQRSAKTAKQMAAVRLVLQRANKPLLAKDIAQLAALDVKTTSEMLVRLRGLRQASEAGRIKTVILWAKDAPHQPCQRPANTPHVPSTQPNGSPEFWSAWTQAMNAPARLELTR
jgi:hypothetical protein